MTIWWWIIGSTLTYPAGVFILGRIAYVELSDENSDWYAPGTRERFAREAFYWGLMWPGIVPAVLIAAVFYYALFEWPRWVWMHTVARETTTQRLRRLKDEAHKREAEVQAAAEAVGIAPWHATTNISGTPLPSLGSQLTPAEVERLQREAFEWRLGGKP